MRNETSVIEFYRTNMFSINFKSQLRSTLCVLCVLSLEYVHLTKGMIVILNTGSVCMYVGFNSCRLLPVNGARYHNVYVNHWIVTPGNSVQSPEHFLVTSLRQFCLFCFGHKWCSILLLET